MALGRHCDMTKLLNKHPAILRCSTTPDYYNNNVIIIVIIIIIITTIKTKKYNIHTDTGGNTSGEECHAKRYRKGRKYVKRFMCRDITNVEHEMYARVRKGLKENLKKTRKITADRDLKQEQWLS